MWLCGRRLGWGRTTRRTWSLLLLWSLLLHPSAFGLQKWNFTHGRSRVHGTHVHIAILVRRGWLSRAAPLYRKRERTHGRRSHREILRWRHGRKHVRTQLLHAVASTLRRLILGERREYLTRCHPYRNIVVPLDRLALRRLKCGNRQSDNLFDEIASNVPGRASP